MITVQIEKTQPLQHNLSKMEIQKQIKELLDTLPDHVSLVAVSKTKPSQDLEAAYQAGQRIFGENKIQEAVDKWTEIKEKKPYIRLHMIGGLQSNKVKSAVKLFDYIHSVDSEKLAKKIADEQSKINKKIKIFIQINIGDENQKSGVNKNEISSLVNYCKKINLNVIGFMCIPPANINPVIYFNEVKKINEIYII